MIRVAELPDDPALLKRLLVEHDAPIDRIKAEAAEQLEALRHRMEAEKKAAIDAILRRFYGPKSERFDPRQLLLFGLQVDAMPLDEPSIQEESGEEIVTRRVRNRHKHGRQQLPEHLPRIEIEHDLPDDRKPCP
ncbi:MAG: transposase [Planctomycetota bacterium]|nr:transposase [Planctomycetota bacterium]